MLEARQGGRRVESIDLVQRPERVEAGNSGVGTDKRTELREDISIPPFAQESNGRHAVPLVRVSQQRHEFRGRAGREVEIGLTRGIRAGDPVDAAGRGIDLVLVVLSVGDVELVHVRHVERAVRGIRDVDRAEGGIGAADKDAVVPRDEGGTLRATFGGDDLASQRVEGEEQSGEWCRQGGAVREGAEVRESCDVVGRGHHRQFAEGIGVARWAELPGIDALHEVEPALDEVPTAGAPAVVSGVEAADGIELESVGVAAAFGEDLEGPCLRVVAPHHATFEVHAGRVRGIEARSTHATGHGAALTAVEPSIGSPGEAIGDGVGVLESKAREAYLGWAVRDVVAVAVGVEEQVGRVHHPHAAVARHGSRGEVEAVDEDRVTVVAAVGAGGFVDGDDVGAAVVVRRGGWDLVVMGAIVLVAGEHPDAGRVGVLPGLRDPEPPAVVEGKVEGLGDGGFVQDEFRSEPFEALLAGGGFGRGREGPWTCSARPRTRWDSRKVAKVARGGCCASAGPGV